MLADTEASSAGLQGSGLLNEEYHDLLTWFLKEDFPSTLAATRVDEAGQIEQILDAAVESFESQKRSFGSNDEREFRINVIPGLRQRFKNSRRLLGPGGKNVPRLTTSPMTTPLLILNREHIVEIFEKIVVEIIGMVKQQVEDFNYKQKHLSAKDLGVGVTVPFDGI